jgi:hypothetical protein
MEQLIPSIGMIGRWTLRPPLENYLLKDVVYTCRAIRSISNYVVNNENPNKIVYDVLGLSDAIYNADFLENVYIASLQSENGTWVHIPCTYIAKYPDNTGVLHQSLMVGIALKTMPKNIDLSAFISKITSAAFDILGVVPETKVVPIDDVIMLDTNISDNLASTRRNHISYTYTDRTRIRVLEEQNTALVKLLQKMKDCAFITCILNKPDENITPPDLYPFDVSIPMTAKSTFLYENVHSRDNANGREPEVPPVVDTTDNITPPDLWQFKVTIPLTAKELFLNDVILSKDNIAKRKRVP